MHNNFRFSQSCGEFARRTAAFLRSTADCSVVVFTWYETETVKPPHFQIGADERMISEYYDRYVTNDPLRSGRLIERAIKVETLAKASVEDDPLRMEQYRPFLEKYKISEEIDFVFWAGEHAVASAAILNMSHTPLELSASNISGVQMFLEYTFSLMPAVKAVNAGKLLTLKYGLTPKELQVTELLIAGESNKSMALALGLELATVKTHLIHIFQKLEVESRGKAIALLTN